MRPSEIPILVGVHEPRTISWFRPRPGECVVDVGAHIGLYALMAANKGARVIAVEPDESNYALLKENVNTNGFDSNVRVFKGVISDVSGERLLYRSTGRNTWMSSVEKGWTPPDTHGVVPVVFVKSMTLDELVSEMNIQRIDWLKVDVEGHEVHVLNGGRRALSITSNLILEVPMGAEADARTCLAILQRTGMRVKATEGCGIVQNWICVRA
jgi:FkbM family methyltransferase